MSQFYATTPIYYVNDRPHIGHGYCTLLADVFCRYHRLFSSSTYFLTGTDEHGQKVMESAQKRDISPQQHVDEYHLHFKNLWEKINITNDDFIRTTEKRHTSVVKTVLQDLFDRGEIYEKEYEGWYSVSVEKFWTEKDLVDGNCPETGNPAVRLKEKNYFFKMSKYQQKLIDTIKQNPKWIYPEFRKNEVLGFLDKPLEDLCISRPKSRLTWGVELPFDSDYVTYVWFDALLNYVSAIGYGTDDKKFNELWPNVYHFLGKDILTTHCVYWTTMLMAMNLPLPKGFVITGWWLKEGEKMSKSVGNVIDPLELIDQYGLDVIRYFLMREMALGMDSQYSEPLILERNNKELANDLGNLLSRTVTMATKNCDGKTPACGELLEVDQKLYEQTQKTVKVTREFVDAFKLKKAIEEVLALLRAVNKYISDTAPFKLFKTDPKRAETIVYVSLDVLRVSSVLLSPVMPEKTKIILNCLGVQEEPSENMLELKLLQGGVQLGEGKNLFPRFDLK